MNIVSGSFESLPDADDHKRQAAWRERNLQKIKASRTWRLEKLRKEQAAIKKAVDAYSVLDGGDVPWVVLRSRFIRLGAARQMILASEAQVEEPREHSPAAQARERRKEIDTRPPLTRLVYRQSNALSLYMTAIYVAHLEAKAGKAFNN